MTGPSPGPDPLSAGSPLSYPSAGSPSARSIRNAIAATDWRAGNFIQYIAAAILFVLGAWLFETRVIQWSADFIFALAWLVVVMSLGAVGLMYWLIRRSAATSMASLFYLVPAVTSLMAFVMFGERLDALSIAGMVVCAVAVLLVNWRRAG
jgi:drug/metabolite transporter (DMT)-like permease